MVENPIELVRSLKGAPLSILFAMAMAGQAWGLNGRKENRLW